MKLVMSPYHGLVLQSRRQTPTFSHQEYLEAANSIVGELMEARLRSINICTIDELV
jgi:hypothetical protein